MFSGLYGLRLLAVAISMVACVVSGCLKIEMPALQQPQASTPANTAGPQQPVEVPEAQQEPGQINLPQTELPVNWNIGVTAAEPAFRPVSLEQHLPAKFRIWGAAMAPGAGQAVVTYMDTADADEKKTYAAFIDLKRSAVTVKFQTPDMLAPFAIHPSGRYVLMCRKDGVLSARETLYLAKRREDGRISFKRWRPLADPVAKEVKLYVKEHEILWAGFAGDSHIITLNRTGKLHLWNLDTLQREGVVTGVKGYPALTPDRQQLAFVTGDVTALLNPATREITGVHRVDGLPRDPVLAFHSRGRYLAIAGKGKCAVVDVTTGYSAVTMVDRLQTSPGMSLKPDFGWAGRFLYANGRLFDFDSSVAVWTFNGGEASMLQGDYLWAVVRSMKSRNGVRPVVLRRYNIPLKHIEKEVAKAMKKSGGVLLRPGDMVEIDVEGVPADQQKAVYQDLSENLTRHGFVPAASAQATLRAYVDRNAVQRQTQYQQISGDRARYTLTYEERRSHMEFVVGGKVRWSDSRSKSPPYFLDNIPGDDFLSQYGGPDYAMYRSGRLPQFIRNSKHSAGRTYYRVEGFNIPQ